MNGIAIDFRDAPGIVIFGDCVIWLIIVIYPLVTGKLVTRGGKLLASRYEKPRMYWTIMIVSIVFASAYTWFMFKVVGV